MKRLKEWWNNIVFEFQMGYYSKRVETLDQSLIKYPLIVSLKLDREWYRKQFDEGISVNDAIMIKATEIATGFKNILDETNT